MGRIPSSSRACPRGMHHYLATAAWHLGGVSRHHRFVVVVAVQRRYSCTPTGWPGRARCTACRRPASRATFRPGLRAGLGRSPCSRGRSSLPCSRLCRCAALVWLLRPLSRTWSLLVRGDSLNQVAPQRASSWPSWQSWVRHPAAWAFAALTKITPFVGPIWFSSSVASGAGFATAVGATAPRQCQLRSRPRRLRRLGRFPARRLNDHRNQARGSPPLWGRASGRRPVGGVDGSSVVGPRRHGRRTPVIAFGSFMVLLARRAPGRPQGGWKRWTRRGGHHGRR